MAGEAVVTIATPRPPPPLPGLHHHPAAPDTRNNGTRCHVGRGRRGVLAGCFATQFEVLCLCLLVQPV